MKNVKLVLLVCFVIAQGTAVAQSGHIPMSDSIVSAVQVDQLKVYSPSTLRARLDGLRRILQGGTGFSTSDLSAQAGGVNQARLQDIATGFALGVSASNANVERPETGVADPTLSNKTLGGVTLDPTTLLYQRMGLEFEAISLDVLLSGAANEQQNSTDGSNRGTVFIGVPISFLGSIDTSKMVAEVEIMLSTGDKASDQGSSSASVVAMLPRARMYNF